MTDQELRRFKEKLAARFDLGDKPSPQQDIEICKAVLVLIDEHVKASRPLGDEELVALFSTVAILTGLVSDIVDLLDINKDRLLGTPGRAYHAPTEEKK